MHWPVDTNPLPSEPSQCQYPADTSQAARPWAKQDNPPTQWSSPPDIVRRRRAAGHNSPLLGRRTARHWDDQEYRPPDAERRWMDRDYPRRWGADPNQEPEPNDSYMPPESSHQFRRNWYSNQYQPDLGHYTRHRASRREISDVPENPSRWLMDPSQRPRRRLKTSSQGQYPWANEMNDPSRMPPQYDVDSGMDRRWAPVPQRRMTTVPPVLTRPNIEVSVPRTRRWRADPSSPNYDSETAQPTVNFILPPQTVGYAAVPPQQPMDFSSGLHHQPMDFGAPRTHQLLDFGAARHHQPLDFGAARPQQPLDFSATLSQPQTDFGAMASHQASFGWYPAHTQMDYGAMMNPLTVNYTSPTNNFGTMSTLPGLDRAGATSAPPNFMWGPEMSHYYPQSA